VIDVGRAVVDALVGVMAVDGAVAEIVALVARETVARGLVVVEDLAGDVPAAVVAVAALVEDLAEVALLAVVVLLAVVEDRVVGLVVDTVDRAAMAVAAAVMVVAATAVAGIPAVGIPAAAMTTAATAKL